MTGVVTDFASTTMANNLVSSSEIAIVRYAYVTIGAIAFVASVLYAAAYGLDHISKHADNQQMPSSQQTTHRENEKKPAERHCREK